MKTFHGFLVAAAAGGAALAVSTFSASAEVVCNDEGDCWHTTQAYTYPPEAGIVVHPEGWAWGANEKYRWHEHQGKGFWRKGEWRED